MHATLVVTLGSGIAWAGFDLTRKHVSRDIKPVPLVTVLSLAQVPFFVALALLSPRSLAVDHGYWGPAALSVTLAVVGNLLFVRALRSAPASVVLPLLSLTPVFSGLAAAIALRERPSTWQLAGSILVMMGAVAMGVLREPLASGGARHGSSLGATSLMVLVAIVWSVLGVTDKECLVHAPLAVHGAIRGASVATVLLAVLAARGGGFDLAAMARRRRSLVFAALVACVAMFLELVALGTVMVSIQESVKRAVGTIASFAIGRIVFGEAITAPKVLAASILTGGVVLLQLRA